MKNTKANANSGTSVKKPVIDNSKGSTHGGGPKKPVKKPAR